MRFIKPGDAGTPKLKPKKELKKECKDGICCVKTMKCTNGKCEVSGIKCDPPKDGKKVVKTKGFKKIGESKPKTLTRICITVDGTKKLKGMFGKKLNKRIVKKIVKKTKKTAKKITNKRR
jgi:hypothetical protein